MLAVATFASVRSGNRAARAAERSLLIGIRPLLMPSHPQDVEQKIMFVDSHWVKAPGGGATAEAVDGAIYLTLSLRNAGSGMAVLHGWVFHPDRILENTHPAASDFRRLARDIYVPASNIGFWQGTFRDPGADEFARVSGAISERRYLTVFILYQGFEWLRAQVRGSAGAGFRNAGFANGGFRNGGFANGGFRNAGWRNL